MTRIKRVGALDGNTLDVELDNGHTILVDFTGTLRRPEYSALADPEVFCSPSTDGLNVVWSDGTSVSLSALIDMLRA